MNTTNIIGRIKKGTATLMMLLVTIIAMSGCTHNNGDIGPWFGTWTLRSITVDDKPYDNYKHNIFWSFQNEVIRIEVDKGLGNFTEHFGTWSQEGDELILNYTHSDDSHLPWEVIFNFPPGIGLPERGIVSMDIITLTGSTLVLNYKTLDGKTMGYHLKKTY